MVKQYTKLLGMNGVNLNITKDALRALAAEATRKGTGTRALAIHRNRIFLIRSPGPRWKGLWLLPPAQHTDAEPILSLHLRDHTLQSPPPPPRSHPRTK